MWVFTTGGFYSIVADRDHPERLLVRARVAGDIEAMWPMAAVEKTPDHDYGFRASIPRHIVAHLLAEETKNIGYDNYKSAVKDRRRLIEYHQVWNILAEMQDALK
jgi:hypothetical protein